MASTSPDDSASAAYARGEYAAAEQAYGALLLTEPKPEPGVLSGWAVRRASCLLRLGAGRAEDAERACRLALDMQPGNDDALEMLDAVALVRQLRGNPAALTERFHQVRCLRPW